MSKSLIETLAPPFGNRVFCPVPSVFMTKFKHICKTEYKYVSFVTYDGQPTYRAAVPKYKWMKCFENVRHALAVDKKLIEKGSKPVNIFVPVNKNYGKLNESNRRGKQGYC